MEKIKVNVNSNQFRNFTLRPARAKLEQRMVTVARQHASTQERRFVCSHLVELKDEHVTPARAERRAAVKRIRVKAEPVAHATKQQQTTSRKPLLHFRLGEARAFEWAVGVVERRVTANDDLRRMRVLCHVGREDEALESAATAIVMVDARDVLFGAQLAGR